MATPSYITPEQAKNYTGAQPRWFDLPSEEALFEELSEWIEHAQDLVTRFIGVEYDPDTTEETEASAKSRLFPVVRGNVPRGVANGVLRIVANMVAQARLRRSTAVLQLDEYTQRLVDDRIFTRAIREDLAMYQRTEPERGGSGSGRGASGSIGLSGMIARERCYVTGFTAPDTIGNWEKDLRLDSTKDDVIHYFYGVLDSEGRRRV